ncbi:hypothetical protein GCM10007989_10320 [Devosia pacifica]|uniref:Uncharacterized protein n=2 Tax=Devosia pacifica TaxID=1335967 RepID=A0A918VRL1_9HYPH|nr:hypothetical protein GCM10007989_10320 [Devosia pacifica]
MSELQLCEELGLPLEHMEPRIQRLLERELVRRQAVGPELLPGLALTERGIRIRNVLAEHWAELEEALLGDLKKKQRKRLSELLERFTALLRL